MLQKRERIQGKQDLLCQYQNSPQITLSQKELKLTESQVFENEMNELR